MKIKPTPENELLRKEATPLYATGLMPEVHIRTREVKTVLANLNIKKSSGADGIPARVLKLCSSLAKPLRNLFFMSFKTGKFPSCWKIANVQPVSKTGDLIWLRSWSPYSTIS